MTKLVIGTGYLGIRVAGRWREFDKEIYVTTRSAARARTLAEGGLRPIIADVMAPLTLKSLPKADTVLYCVGFDRKSGYSAKDLYVKGLSNVLATMVDRTERFVYISSTGVFGQEDGSWVHELSECQPIRPGGRACLAAERRLTQSALGRYSIILRLAGIYGPDRVPRRAELLSEKPILADVDGYLNLIHVEDAVSAIVAVEAVDDLPRLYLVSDGTPVTRQHYFDEVARLLDINTLQIESPSPGDRDFRRTRGNKRIDSSKFQKELSFSPHYPTYREGLAAILEGNSG